MAVLGLCGCAGFRWWPWAGAALPCGAPAAHCGGASWCGVRAPGVWASAAASRGRISRGSWALGHGLPCSEACEIFLDLPGPGIEPASPALQAAFAPEPPVRSQAAQIVTVWPDCTLLYDVCNWQSLNHALPWFPHWNRLSSGPEFSRAPLSPVVNLVQTRASVFIFVEPSFGKIPAKSV